MEALAARWLPGADPADPLTLARAMVIDRQNRKDLRQAAYVGAALAQIGADGYEDMLTPPLPLTLEDKP